MKKKNIFGISAIIAAIAYSKPTGANFKFTKTIETELYPECETTREDYLEARARELGIEAKGFLQFPLRGNITITSAYGYRKDPVLKRKGIKKRVHHNGLDIDSDQREIYPLTTGTLCYATGNEGYGNYMVNIPENNLGLEYMYGHLKSATEAFLEGTQTARELGLEGVVEDALCKEITEKEKEQVLAYMGSTGYSTGTHLHLMFGTPSEKQWTNTGIPFFEPYDPTALMKVLYKEEKETKRQETI